MAFSTIQGSGGAPDSFVGTSGVDTIAIVNSTGNFFLGAQEANDVVTFVSGATEPGVISTATLRGGAGADAFADSANVNVFSGAFFHGNGGLDTFNLTNAGFIGSTLQGGQGGDLINLGGGQIASSLINGNRDNDSINSTGGSASASLFGGQGNDTINLALNAHVSSSIVGGDGNDNIATAGNISIIGTAFEGGDGNDTINLASVQTAANGGVVITGGAGNDGLTGTGGTDTIDGGAANDTIAGGADIDSLTVGAGTNVVNQRTDATTLLVGQTVSGAATVTTFGAAVVAAGQSVTFGNGVDVVTDFNSGSNSVRLEAAGLAANYVDTVGDATVFAGGLSVAVRGVWAAATNTFTFNAAGGDVLVLDSVAGNLSATATFGDQSAVLIGAATGFSMVANITA